MLSTLGGEGLDGTDPAVHRGVGFRPSLGKTTVADVEPKVLLRLPHGPVAEVQVAPLGRFHIATEDDIRKGRTTDVYFPRTLEVLRAAGRARAPALAEFTTYWLHDGVWEWGIFCGLEECLHLMEGRKVTLRALPEGTLFRPRTQGGVRVPVMTIEGPYEEFCLYETPLLGMICQATAVATKAARVKKAAGDRAVISFGLRRMHPAIAPMIDRAAYLGGCDAVAGVLSAEFLGLEAQGTMPHALVIVMGDPRKAFEAYDRGLAEGIPRIALVDTYFDEKTEAVIAAETIPKLDGVRLDTPSSRRGNFAEIVREVRWELDVRGHRGVKVYLSGGLNEYNIPGLAEAGADGFGVGTAISNAPTVDFAMDIVEVEGRPAAKRGKFGGRKGVYRCAQDFTYEVGPRAPRCPRCGGAMDEALETHMEAGKILKAIPKPRAIREYVVEQLARVELDLSRPPRG
jgi:nicotinate phosphoribosyltransferase